MLALIEPAYLAARTPQAQSGLSGDARRWEQARRLLLDAVDGDGTFLDVGCADGLPRWADRIWTANAHGWRPPRRFTYVRTGLDYVPRRHTRDYLHHLLAAGVEADGLRIAGRASRRHRHPALSYEVLWIDAPGRH